MKKYMNGEEEINALYSRITNSVFRYSPTKGTEHNSPLLRRGLASDFLQQVLYGRWERATFQWRNLTNCLREVIRINTGGK